MTHLRANGKLLLTGEYFVLDGVAGLAVPTKLGQTLTVSPVKGEGLNWEAYAKDGGQWFSGAFERGDWAGTQVQSEDVRAGICRLLRAAEELKTGSTSQLIGTKVETRLEFDRHWGLGSSSTLVACLAKLLEVNPYELLAKTFGGSGYDLACAVTDVPIVYERSDPFPKVTKLDWRPEWVKGTVFVYRNQKQNSREGIRAYRSKTVSEQSQREIGELTTALLSPTLDLRSAAQILKRHEEVISQTIGLPTIQEELFVDFPGQLKSLGAWGGDFFWALSEETSDKVRVYFNERGYETVITYEDMVL
jgi:mevalonate kinase